MALLGLLLLPSEYRAGAESAHGHSFVHLWVDAGDGIVHHGHHHQSPSDPGPAHATSWFDPLIGESGSAQNIGVDDERPDVMEQQESAPAAGGIHLLLTAVPVTLAVGARQAPAADANRALTGLFPRILLPPPRWTPAAA